MGTEKQANSAGGPAFSSCFSRGSQVTNQATRVDQKLLDLRAVGTVTGSANFTSNDSSTGIVGAALGTYMVNKPKLTTYSFDDTVTETLGAGGTVSSGSESFTWSQGPATRSPSSCTAAAPSKRYM